MRDVNNGWLLRYIHSNTASAFFFLVSLFVFPDCFYLCDIFIIFIVNPLVIGVKRFLSKLMFRGRGKGNHSILFSNFSAKRPPLWGWGNKRGYASKPNPNSLSDEDFSEWFRGFEDGREIFLYKPFKTVLN